MLFEKGEYIYADHFSYVTTLLYMLLIKSIYFDTGYMHSFSRCSSEGTQDFNSSCHGKENIVVIECKNNVRRRLYICGDHSAI
jgi:hypothetical protein